jgi:(p)ppGpp synthase/HD superfamily hydrolase
MEMIGTHTKRIFAVLHDVIEDTNYTLTTIKDRFDSEVRGAVGALTKLEGEHYLDISSPSKG